MRMKKIDYHCEPPDISSTASATECTGAEAKRYFDSLPDYVRDQISSRADSVNTFAGLRDYADNLLRGDD